MINLGSTEKLAMNSHPAESVEDATRGKDSIIEPKFDGIRLLIRRDENGVQMFARSGKSKTGKLPAIETLLESILPDGTWLDCEAVSFNLDGTQDWGGAQSVLGSNVEKAQLIAGKIKLVVFDVLAYDNMDARSLPFRQRRELLEMIFDWTTNSDPIMLSPTMPATDEAHAANLEFGFEGSMLKHLDAPYQSGRRSKSSCKLKAQDTVDAIIIGSKPGRPDSWIAKSGLVGAITFVHFENGEPIEGACSGMTVSEREMITRQISTLIAEKAVIEVSYMTRMPGGKLRHPQFKRIRDDKTAAECVS